MVGWGKVAVDFVSLCKKNITIYLTHDNKESLVQTFKSIKLNHSVTVAGCVCSHKLSIIYTLGDEKRLTGSDQPLCI